MGGLFGLGAESYQRLQTLANDVRVRELSFVRKVLPSRVEQRARTLIRNGTLRLGAKPGLQILLNSLLRPQPISNDHDRTARQLPFEQGQEKGMRS